MGDSIPLVYFPDGHRVRPADLHNLAKLSSRVDPIWGWLNVVDQHSGRFTRRLSHRVLSVEHLEDHLLIKVEPVSADAGRLLRKLYDECAPLGLSPYLRGSTDDGGAWVWSTSEIIAWDVYLLPEPDSELDRIVRAIEREHHKRHR